MSEKDTEQRTEFHYSFIIPLVLAAALAAIAWFIPTSEAQKLIISFVPAGLTVYVAYLVRYNLIIANKLDKVQSSVDRNRSKDRETANKLEKAIDNINFASDFVNKITMVGDKTETIRKVSQKAIGQFVANLDVNNHEDRVVFSGQQTSIAAYAEFWRIIRDEQRRRKKKDEQPLVARITHSNSIEIWLRDGLSKRGDLAKIRTYEEDFVEADGAIFRILVNADRTPKNSDRTSDYLTAAKRMGGHGVVPAYVDISQDINGDFDDPEYDFIMVDLGDDGVISLLWRTSGSARYIGGCEISTESEFYDQHEPKWREYMRRLRDAPIEHEELKKLNDEFIKLHDEEFTVSTVPTGDPSSS